MQSNKESFMELSADCLAKAVVFLVGIYYIFHLQYPGPAKGAFMFLQEHILHDFLSKRPLKVCYAVGRNEAVVEMCVN